MNKSHEPVELIGLYLEKALEGDRQAEEDLWFQIRSVLHDYSKIVCQKYSIPEYTEDVVQDVVF